MTLQERMVAVYLRQAKLPEAEKDKLRLFLGLLLTTLEKEEPWEMELRAAPEALAIRFEGEGTAVRSLGDARDDNTPVPEDDLTDYEEPKEVPKPVDPLAGEGASEETAEGSSADAPGEEPGTWTIDPLVEAVRERMEAEGLSRAKVVAATGVHSPTLNRFLAGCKMKAKTRQAIEEWMETWLLAKEILG